MKKALAVVMASILAGCGQSDQQQNADLKVGEGMIRLESGRATLAARFEEGLKVWEAEYQSHGAGVGGSVITLRDARCGKARMVVGAIGLEVLDGEGVIACGLGGRAARVQWRLAPTG